MNKRELTKKVAERSGHTQATSALIINTFISCILESLEAGEKVTIQDFSCKATKNKRKIQFDHQKSGKIFLLRLHQVYNQ